MSKRIRLTDRRRQAVDGTIPYPGTVNQPDRQFKQHAQYDNWKEVVNHPLPDMRHLWKREHTPEGRDEIGFGIPEPYGTQPTFASLSIAADKSVRAAVLMLGEKVAEDVIEDQARDFMLMGGEALDRTLARFSSTEGIYKVAEDDDDDDDDAKSAADESDEKADAEKADAEKEASDDDDDDDDDDSKEASTELAVAAEDNPTTIPEQPAESTGSQDGKQKGASAKFNADVQAKIAEMKAEVKAQASNREAYNRKVIEAAKKALGTVNPVPAAPVAGEMDIDIPERVSGPNEMDIELSASMDSEIRPDTQADAMLAGLFDDGTPTDAELPAPNSGREASAKHGINSLGGQPKVASANAGNSADISSIWDSAPDVSEIFK